MDPIDRGMWFAIEAPFRCVSYLWETATNPSNYWYCRLPAFFAVIGIQHKIISDNII